MKRAYERFLSYVAYDTTSDEKSTTFPSTPGQKVLAAVLEKEMKEAARMLEFELAAQLRDQIIRLKEKD